MSKDIGMYRPGADHHAELRELIKVASRAAEMVFTRQQAIHYPIWHAVDGQGESHIIEAPVSKDLAVALVRAKLALVDAVMVVSISEAWAMQSKEDATAEQRMAMKKAIEMLRAGGTIADHPDRIEIIAFTGEDVNGALLAERRILRPEHGPAKLAPLIFQPPGYNEGRMVGLLPVRGRAF